MAKGYIRGREAAGVHETHHHVMPVKAYLGVFGALMVLTALTVLVSEMNLGSAALAVAMVVAAIKSAFVIGFFMHLKYDTRFHSFVFFGTLLFIGIFFLMTFIDINTRALVNKDWGNTAWVLDRGVEIPPAPVPHEEGGEAHEPSAEVKDGEAAPAPEVKDGEAKPAAEAKDGEAKPAADPAPAPETGR
ncbi:MAG: hypothetical protein CVU56_00950 [Deltaproteobacteria bacterium HGW-Deltaproteobacteria-14]|jgi:cytochrome c oxidase subunit 4|nr:MAG: hypothetical protein CVU56_00950 [Deltaproteobacteria bacterium HGW-Deltaproteobacteria-14]